MAFSVAVWNVENLRRNPNNAVDAQRAANVAAFLAAQDPDVFALLEIRGRDVFFPLLTAMPTHSFFITESATALGNPQEILVGVRDGIQAFTTQRLQFRSGLPTMRPGALLTVQDNGDLYPILFLHLKSTPTPHGFGTRDDQINRALDFRNVLAAQAAGLGVNHGYIFAGDLNTMGMDLSYHQADVTAEGETDRIRELARRRNMTLLPKTAAHTWWNGGNNLLPTDLDHAVATTNVTFSDQGAGALVDVRGWAQLQDQARNTWIDTHSDHNLLYLEITGLNQLQP